MPRNKHIVRSQRELVNDEIRFKQKKKLKRTELSAPLLPPCMVCTGKATGSHFGAITCEACKIFFKRSFNRSTPYSCNKKNGCDIKPGRKNSCSACRLDKCLNLGMSLHNFQKGRHTLERKTQYIIMAKQHQEKSSSEGYPFSQFLEKNRTKTEFPILSGEIIYSGPKKPNGLNASKTPRCPSNTGIDFCTALTGENVTDISILPRNDVKSRGIEPTNSNKITSSAKCGTSLVHEKFLKLKHKWTNQHNLEELINGVTDLKLHPSHSHGLSEKVPLMWKLFFNADLKKLCQGGIFNEEDHLHIPNIFSTTTNIDDVVKYFKILNYKFEIFVEGSESIMHHREMLIEKDKYLKESIFGSMKTVPHEQYKALFKSTGIDVDGRLHKIQTCVSYTEVVALYYMEFVKKIPGFNDLHTDDQLYLFSTSYLIWSFLTLHKFSSPERHYTHCPCCEEIFSEQEWSAMYYMNDDQTKLHFNTLKIIHDLKLDQIETGILKAIILLSTDNCYQNLVEPDKVEKLQEYYMVIFVNYLCRTRADWVCVYGRIVHWLSAMQELCHFYEMAYKKWTDKDCPIPLTIPPIINEISILAYLE